MGHFSGRPTGKSCKWWCSEFHRFHWNTCRPQSKPACSWKTGHSWIPMFTTCLNSDWCKLWRNIYRTRFLLKGKSRGFPVKCHHFLEPPGNPYHSHTLVGALQPLMEDGSWNALIGAKKLSNKQESWWFLLGWLPRWLWWIIRGSEKKFAFLLTFKSPYNTKINTPSLQVSCTS